MARRSSARLRNRNSSTPKRVSLSHDGAGRTPRTAPVKLYALQENDEMPGAFPQSASPPARRTSNVNSKHTTTIPVNFHETTPQRTTPVKPTHEEMDPKQHQQSTAKPLEEARWLGFTNMGPHTEPAKQASKIATLQGTPTRATKKSTDVNTPRFRFTFQREQSLELSPEAKKLMTEKREEAARIRQQMVADGDEADDVESALGRKIATPKGKKGRFSGVHMEQFKKMDSIANHASAFRASKTAGTSIPTQTSTSSQKVPQTTQSATKSLKRSPSKAQLDEPEQHSQSTLPRSASKLTLGHMPSHLPRTTSTKLPQRDQQESPSPTKRVKCFAAEDVSTARPSESSSDKAKPATPQPNKVNAQPTYPDLSTIASPTQASLARASSIKSVQLSRIPAPNLARSPSKPNLQEAARDGPKPSTPLLARSPSKGSLFADAAVEKPKAMMSPLLLRSPLKASTLKKSEDDEEMGAPKTKEAPLLSRSPLKMSVAKSADSAAGSEKPSSSTPLLARLPAKINLSEDNVNGQPSHIPSKPSQGGLMGRFNLLRHSPMKSILRSPQRLYSDDPAKVAAGTHLATPPKYRISKDKNQDAGVTESAQKRVDFSSSTKARYERAQSELSSTPSKGPTPPPKDEPQAGSSPKPSLANYPSLPNELETPAVSPQKRRQTAVPSDFTFRAGEQAILFRQSPNAPPSSGSNKRPSTIRHVSAEPRVPPAPVLAPANTARKRKFDFENDKAADTEMVGATSDKENAGGEEEVERPAKRVKPSAPSPAPSKPVAKRPTLGVKPKKGTDEVKDKKPSSISRARLNALSQPKRRA